MKTAVVGDGDEENKEKKEKKTNHLVDLKSHVCGNPVAPFDSRRLLSFCGRKREKLIRVCLAPELNY